MTGMGQGLVLVDDTMRNPNTNQTSGTPGQQRRNLVNREH